MKRLQNFLNFGSFVRSCSSKQTDVARHIRNRILATGPLTVAQYMKEILTNPSSGYYTTAPHIFGTQGDFITSPEISQLFSEMIAVWFLNEWERIGSPSPFHLIELGPGRGIMMKNIIKVFRKFNAHEKMDIRLVEVSESLSVVQSQQLNVTLATTAGSDEMYKSGITDDNIPVSWYKSLYDIKFQHFSLIVAHEFFDALPIHKFQKTKSGWREVLIDIDPRDETKFRYVLSPNETAMSKIFVKKDETREQVEVSSDVCLMAKYLAQKMEKFGGIGLVVDYGHLATKTDTFRAYYKHKQCDPLLNVGQADLTADVDFKLLKESVADKLVTFGPVTQQFFLKQVGLEVRFQMLLNNIKDESKRKKLEADYHMLTDDDKMGKAFHFLSMFPAVLKPFFEKHPVVGFIE